MRYRKVIGVALSTTALRLSFQRRLPGMARLAQRLQVVDRIRPARPSGYHVVDFGGFRNVSKGSAGPTKRLLSQHEPPEPSPARGAIAPAGRAGAPPIRVSPRLPAMPFTNGFSIGHDDVATGMDAENLGDGGNPICFSNTAAPDGLAKPSKPSKPFF